VTGRKRAAARGAAAGTPAGATSRCWLCRGGRRRRLRSREGARRTASCLRREETGCTGLRDLAMGPIASGGLLGTRRGIGTLLVDLLAPRRRSRPAHRRASLLHRAFRLINPFERLLTGPALGSATVVFVTSTAPPARSPQPPNAPKDVAATVSRRRRPTSPAPGSSVCGHHALADFRDLVRGPRPRLLVKRTPGCARPGFHYGKRRARGATAVEGIAHEALPAQTCLRRSGTRPNRSSCVA
jgi:hypothetical protein